MPPIIHRRLQSMSFSRATIALSALVAAAYFAFSLRSHGPVYQADEIGYLTYAALFAGKARDFASSYYAGYSLLISPAFMLFRDPSNIWLGVLAINAILWFSVILLVAQLGRRLFPDAGEKEILLGAFACAVYPSWALFSSYAFCTPAFVLVYTVFLNELSKWDRERGPSFIALGSLGFLSWVHPTALPVVALSVVVISILSLIRGHRVSALGRIGFVVALVVSYSKVVHPLLGRLMTPAGLQRYHDHYPTLRQQFDVLTKGSETMNFAAMMAGSTAYALIASLGLVGVGIAACLARSWEQVSSAPASIEQPGRIATLAIAALAPLAILPLSAFSLIPQEHGATDIWIYGRYIEVTFAPLLLIGMLHAVRSRAHGLVAVVCLAAGLFIAASIDDRPLSHNVINTVSFWPAYLVNGGSVLTWIVAGSIGLLLFSFAPRAGVFLVLMPIMALSLVAQDAWHQKLQASVSRAPGLQRFIRDNYPPSTCVAFDGDLSNASRKTQQDGFNLDAFYLVPYHLMRMSSQQWAKNCSGLYLTYNNIVFPSQDVDIAAYELSSGMRVYQKKEIAKDQYIGNDDVALGSKLADQCSVLSCVFRSAWELENNSQCGILRGGQLVTTAVDCYLIYGPYAKLEKGSYVVTFLGSFNDPDGATVDVVSNKGEKILSDAQIIDEKSAKEGVLKVRLMVPQPEENVEFRMHVSEKTVLSVKSVEAVPESASGSP